MLGVHKSASVPNLQEKKRADPSELNVFDRAKLGVERLVEKVGFLFT